MFPTLFGTGLMAVTLGDLFSWWSHPAARLGRSLLQNQDVLARWRVNLATWQQFIALNRTFSTNTNLVFPVPPHAIAEATTVLHYFQHMLELSQ